MILRCPHCRTRRSTWQLMAQHLKDHPECAPCDCGGYGWRNGGTLHRWVAVKVSRVKVA